MARRRGGGEEDIDRNGRKMRGGDEEEERREGERGEGGKWEREGRDKKRKGVREEKIKIRACSNFEWATGIMLHFFIDAFTCTGIQRHLQFTYMYIHQEVFWTHSSWLAESLPQSQVTFLSLQPPHPSQHYHCHGDHLLSGRQRGWGQCGCYTSSKRLSKRQ